MVVSFQNPHGEPEKAAGPAGGCSAGAEAPRGGTSIQQEIGGRGAGFRAAGNFLKPAERGGGIPGNPPAEFFGQQKGPALCAGPRIKRGPGGCVPPGPLCEMWACCPREGKSWVRFLLSPSSLLCSCRFTGPPRLLTKREHTKELGLYYIYANIKEEAAVPVWGKPSAADPFESGKESPYAWKRSAMCPHQGNRPPF